MTGWRGLAAGALTLIAIQAVVTTRQGPQRVGGIFDVIAGAVRRFVDPTVAAIPDRRTKTTATATTASSSAASTTPYPNPSTPPTTRPLPIPGAPVESA